MDTLFAPGEELSATPETQPTIVPLSAAIEKFLAQREKQQAFYTGEASTIRVSQVLGSIAHLYEKIRNVVEYKGEHVLQRNAIERILKRLLWERVSHDTERIAQILIRELIWARYLRNDTVPKRKIPEVAAIISKYLYLLGALTQRSQGIPLNDLRNWIWGVASCEIEETLDPSNREPYVQLMFDWFTTHFDWHNDDLSAHEKQMQIYLAIHRALTKSDEQIMRYHLLCKEFPDWSKAQKSTVDTLIENFFKIYTEIERHLQFPDRFPLYRIVQRQVAPFEVLRELMLKEGNQLPQVLGDIQTFESKVREICQTRYAQIQKKVNRGIVRSIIYIFATKVLLALLIEVPYEIYSFGKLSYLPLGVNVIVPPALMFLIGLSIKAPGEDNTQRIIAKLKSIIYTQNYGAKTVCSLARAKRGTFLAHMFALIYMILFLIVFGAITYFLWQLHFTIVGIVIFFIFLSLVLLFGFRVRFTASELKITGSEESFFGYIFNNLTLPFLSTGVYLSKGLAKINFLTIILDFLIEAPLKTVIDVVEEWTSFVREKREEVVEVPQQ